MATEKWWSITEIRFSQMIGMAHGRLSDACNGRVPIRHARVGARRPAGRWRALDASGDTSRQRLSDNGCFRRQLLVFIGTTRTTLV